MVSEEQNSDIELASEVIPVPQVHQPEVEAPVPKDTNETDQKANDIPHGKPRLRKKALHAAILKQMEFYFGDSNLSKDRFLSELIKECPDVPLDTFIKFNKIRSLTTDIGRIAKALSKSTMLQVSENGKTVRRITPIVEKQNIDECTVYVQRLPSDADHEWLSSLFSEYGPVAYVSIPKFKATHKIKGFAFVEFETPDGAKKCLKAFRAKGCELPSQTSPTEVLSITTFAEEEKEEQNGPPNSESADNTDRKQKIEKSVDPDEPKAKKRGESLKSDVNKECVNNDEESRVCLSDSNAQKEEKRGKKRKNKLSAEEAQISETELQNVSEIKIKKQKTAESEAETESENSSKNELNKDGKKRKKIKVEVESESENLIKNEIDKEESSKKRKKPKIDVPKIVIESVDTENEDVKKEENDEVVESTNDEGEPEKKKKKKRKRKHHASYEVLQTVDMGLQVMGKKDWKKLRNKYLELQRAKMKQLKQNIKRARWNQWGDKGKMETEQEETTGTKKENTASGLEFIPNVIVKIELNEPCIDPKSFKAELRSNSSNIKYVDVKEGSHEAYVRCDSSEAAAALAQKSNEEKNLRVLTGDEEIYYWDKITRDREEKIGNKVRVNQRGRNKLLKKAEKELGKHIRFDKV
ncbi:hypothetical protein TSAR_002253 [Trichomalopsis sarcophagae]|uniref:La-related protein 7 n=1 Tax=Trichomalopsis sarcophagae TaxID=543379 RepID=A0A232EWL9_9HYME|nr:hypothetical protein TSAR_002253 [Trichomalopsis sarcophagae]